jgi:ribosomal protein S18 acetylase RimI-like enzyme
MRFRALSGEAESTCEIPLALPWVHAASQPYTDWLFGGRSEALRILAEWMRRPSSEVFIGRAMLALEENQPVGGVIALNGAELAACRRHDALAAVAATPSGRRSSLLSRLRLGRGLLPEPLSDDLYLSRMGVVEHARGRGYGKAILLAHLQHGIRQGFRRFSLDVYSGNTPAIGLYRSVGFRPERRRHVEVAGMSYVRMAMDVPPEGLDGQASPERLRVMSHPVLAVEPAQGRSAERDRGQHVGIAGVKQRP